MINMNVAIEKIEKGLDRVEKWVEQNDYRGYEPFDGLTSYLVKLTLKNRSAGQILQQVVRRFPINLRPILGIRPQDSNKGRGYMAWGYLHRFRQEREDRYKNKAFVCLDWLDKNKSPALPEHSWGNHFVYVSRGGVIPKFEPTIVWTGLIGEVFLEAYGLFGNVRHRDVIKSIAEGILTLPRYPYEKGVCLSYTRQNSRRQGSIHNSNMIGAAFLAGAARILNNNSYLELARKAMEYSCSRQLDDGAWYYGEDSTYHWVDAFHTGYNLDSLKRYLAYSGDASFRPHLQKGFEFFKNNFFIPTGMVKYYNNKAKPIDIQCGSQAIDTLSLFSDVDPECRDMALKASLWYINHMQDKDGYFYFRKYPFGLSNKAPMIHWGQATMHKALAHALSVIRSS